MMTKRMRLGDVPAVANPRARVKPVKYEPLSAERYYLAELLREIEHAAGAVASLHRVAKTIGARLRRTTATSNPHRKARTR